MPDYMFTVVGIAVGAVIMWLIMRSKTSTVDTSIDQSKQLVGQIREVVQSQLLNNHPKLFQAIAKQKVILNEQRRESIAIFLSSNMFKELMQNADAYSDEQIEILYETMRDLRMPVGFLGELPIYISELMLDAPVFVVGAISWSFDR